MRDGSGSDTFPQVKQRTGMIIRVRNSENGLWKRDVDWNCGGMGDVNWEAFHCKLYYPFCCSRDGAKQTEYGIPLSITSLSKPPESTSEQNKKVITIYCPIFQMLECHREINCLHRRQSYSFTLTVCPHPVAYNRRHIGKCCCLLLDDRWWWSSASVILQIDSSHWGKPTIIKVPLFRSLKQKALQPNWRVVSSGRSDNHFTINDPTLKASR